MRRSGPRACIITGVYRVCTRLMYPFNHNKEKSGGDRRWRYLSCTSLSSKLSIGALYGPMAPRTSISVALDIRQTHM